MAELQDNLPPGWDCKMDSVTGKYYYINHFTKTTTWEDPRTLRHRHGTSKYFQNMNVEHIPLQHGSPDLKRNYVYPSHTSPIPAFQMPAHQSPKSNPLQDLKNITRMSPLTVRSSKVQDSSLTNVVDTEEAVRKISAMFPTVSETHIRLLMKKYHNREALVISALQVEKYPITTPGPFATPPPQRNIHHPSIYHMHMTPPLGLRMNSRGGSPILRPGSGGTNSTSSPRIGEGAFRSSPRPHSSPKLKLRYMKSIFPQAEETIILEVLSNNENNIQKSSDILKDMGFQKKDAVKVAQQKMEAKIETAKVEEAKKHEVPAPIREIKTAEEKAALKTKLEETYKHVANHLITMALESVDFNEGRAIQILEIVVQEDTGRNNHAIETEAEKKDQISEIDSKTSTTLPISQSRQSIKSLLKSEKNDKEKTAFSRVVEEPTSVFKSPNLANTKGANPDLAKGANDNILLADYVNWQGPKKNLRKGPQQGLAKGANPNLLCNRSYQPCGSNAEYYKGPNFGLAKGSIFNQLKSLVIGESRGK